MAVTIKSAHEIELMRESCRLLSLVFDGMEKMIKPGITTAEINQLGDQLIREYGGKWFMEFLRIKGCYRKAIS